MVSALPPGHRGRLFSVALGPNNGPTPRSHGLHVATDISRMSPRLLRAAALAVSIALATAVAPARAEVAAAPFDGNLQRLAEILGALHYLRNICGANEGLKWRNEMQSLVDAETPGGELHAGRGCGHSPLPGGRFQDRARDDRALRKLTRDLRIHRGAARAPGAEWSRSRPAPVA